MQLQPARDVEVGACFAGGSERLEGVVRLEQAGGERRGERAVPHEVVQDDVRLGDVGVLHDEAVLQHALGLGVELALCNAVHLAHVLWRRGECDGGVGPGLATGVAVDVEDLVLHGRHDAEVVAGAADGPEEGRVLGGRDGERGSVGEGEAGAEELVGGQAVEALEEAVAAAEDDGGVAGAFTEAGYWVGLGYG